MTSKHSYERCPVCGDSVQPTEVRCDACGERLVAVDTWLTDELKKVRRRPDPRLTTVDGIICLFCPVVGCIGGVVSIIVGNHVRGSKMIGITILVMLALALVQRILPWLF